MLRVDAQLTPGNRYFVEVLGARNLNGAQAGSHTSVSIPKAPPPPRSPLVRPDSNRFRVDSLRHDTS